MTVDAQNLYIAESDQYQGDIGFVIKVPLAGGTPTTLASDQPYPMSILVVGNDVYWASMNSNHPGLFSVPTSGGDRVSYANDQATFFLTADANNVYWGRLAEVPAVNKMPLGGGPITQLATSDSRHLPGGIAVDAQYVYWLSAEFDDFADSRVPYHTMIMKVPISGGDVMTLADIAAPNANSGRLYSNIAVDATSVYWRMVNDPTAGTTSVWKVPVAGGTPVRLAQTNAMTPIVIDSSYIYWGEAFSIMRLPLEGGTPTALITIPADDTMQAGYGTMGTELAIDADYVYCQSYGADIYHSGILRVSKD